MAIPKVIVKTGTIPVGTTNLPEVNLPPQVVGAGIEVERWADPTTVLSATFEISLDSQGRMVINTGMITLGDNDNATRAIPSA